MSANYPNTSYILPPLSQEIVAEQVRNDTFERRTLRANIIYQASCIRPSMMHLHSPRRAGLLLRHAISAVEAYQATMPLREVITDVLCPQKTANLKKLWAKLPLWEERELVDYFSVWLDLSSDNRQELLSLWWRSDTGESNKVLGFSDDFFSPKDRNRYERKMIQAITRRILESVPFLVKNGEFDKDYVSYLVSLAWREYQAREETQRNILQVGINGNQFR